MAPEGFSGHCLCWQVRYTVDKAPAWVGHCHCGSCRRQVASAVAKLDADGPAFDALPES